jgi:hypothetical protein
VASVDGAVVQSSENAVKPADFRLGGRLQALALEDRGSRLAAAAGVVGVAQHWLWWQTAEGQRHLAGSGTVGLVVLALFTLESPTLHMSGAVLMLARRLQPRSERHPLSWSPTRLGRGAEAPSE